MKKIVIFLMPIFVFAKGLLLSDLPLPENFYIDLDPNECNTICLNRLKNDELYFSFLAKYASSNDKSASEKNYIFITSMLAKDSLQTQTKYDFSKQSANVKLAILLSHNRIKKFAPNAINSIVSYLFARNSGFDIEVFDIQNESEKEILKALEEIKNKNYKALIAPLTPQGASILVKEPSEILIYIPTVHSSIFTEEISSNILFGGIDYEAQIKKLFSFANTKIASFNDGSSLSVMLENHINANALKEIYSNQISGDKMNLKSILNKNYRLMNASIFLNMPLVKTSLLTSQLRAFELKPHVLLSTQINYDPLLLALTQSNDIKKLLIANSIKEVDFQIRATNDIFNNSIEYNWVSYSVSTGLDYLFANFFSSNARIFNEDISINQIIYDIDIYKPTDSGFENLHL